MARPLQTYYCASWLTSKVQISLYGAFTTQKAFLETANEKMRFPISRNEFKNFGGTTGNVADIAVTQARPGVLFYRGANDFGKPLKEVP